MAHPYGTDFAGLLDVNRQLTLAEGTDVLASDIVGILLDDHLFYDEDHCYQLERNLLNAPFPTNLGEIEAGIEAKVSRDPRVDEVKATVEQGTNAGDLKVTVAVVGSNDTEFTLVGSITNFTAQDFVVI